MRAISFQRIPYPAALTEIRIKASDRFQCPMKMLQRLDVDDAGDCLGRVLLLSERGQKQKQQ